MKKKIILLAAVLAIAIPSVSHAQLGGLGAAAKRKAVELLTEETMTALEKKFTEIIEQETLSAAAKTNIVKALSDMARPTVTSTINGAASGKLPNVTELSTAVLKDILPRVPTLVASALLQDTPGSGMPAAAPAAGAPGGKVAAPAAVPTGGKGSPTVNGALPVASGYDPEKDFTATAINNGNAVRITKYNGKNTDVKIPPSIDNRTVAEIGEQAFVKKGLTSVAIPDSVISIGNMAFAGNPIGSVSIGANVYIADNAFENSGYNAFSSTFYNSQGRKAGNYANSWRLVSATTSVGPISTATASGGAQTGKTQTKGTVVENTTVAGGATGTGTGGEYITLETAEFKPNKKNPSTITFNINMENIEDREKEVLNINGTLASQSQTWSELTITNKSIIEKLKNGSGIRFKVIGDGNDWLLLIVNVSGGNYNYYSAGIKTTINEIIEIDIPYSELREHNSGNKVKFNKKSITHLAFGMGNSIEKKRKAGKYSIKIFDLEIY